MAPSTHNLTLWGPGWDPRMDPSIDPSMDFLNAMDLCDAQNLNHNAFNDLWNVNTTFPPQSELEAALALEDEFSLDQSPTCDFGVPMHLPFEQQKQQPLPQSQQLTPPNSALEESTPVEWTPFIKQELQVQPDPLPFYAVPTQPDHLHRHGQITPPGDCSPRVHPSSEHGLITAPARMPASMPEIERRPPSMSQIERKPPSIPQRERKPPSMSQRERKLPSIPQRERTPPSTRPRRAAKRRRRTVKVEEESNVNLAAAAAAAAAEKSGDSPGAGENSADAVAKRRHFLERNRQAAYTCRQRKKEWSKALDDSCRGLETRNKGLKLEVSALQEELRYLRRQMLEHTSCGCTGVRDYVSKQAKDLLTDGAASGSVTRDATEAPEAGEAAVAPIAEEEQGTEEAQQISTTASANGGADAGAAVFEERRPSPELSTTPTHSPPDFGQENPIEAQLQDALACFDNESAGGLGLHIAPEIE